MSPGARWLRPHGNSSLHSGRGGGIHVRPLSEFRNSLPASRKNQTCDATSRLALKFAQLGTHLPCRVSAGAGRGARQPVVDALQHTPAEYEAQRAAGGLPKSTISGVTHFVRPHGHILLDPLNCLTICRSRLAPYTYKVVFFYRKNTVNEFHSVTI